MAGSIVYFTQRASARGRLTHDGKAILLLIGFAMAGLVLNGCTLFKPSIVVPTYDTAREQAMNAELQFQRTMRTVDKDQKKDELEKAEAALKTAIARFPEDREYIPPAYTLLGRVYMLQNKPKKAESTFRTVIRNYSDVPDVHAEALFGMAEALGAQKKFEEEKRYYGQLREQYKTSTDPRIQRKVAIAARRYAEVERAN